MRWFYSTRQYLTTAFRWQKGRQGTGYDKMLLLTASWPVRFDSYLIRYPEGAEIPPHTDPVAVGRHYRLNIVLKASHAGGEFVCATPLFATRRIKLFRPDACEHSVTRVVGGSRYVLSLGWVLKKSAA
ncbi:MAG: 2OG-Fe(II) oxygenase [Halopseudomonas sp.]|uniref:2OG-Fe(II) oxygenase n=1 Tax=Halopseudomonas sp. TaxID=2901191 RepID=UPI003001A799